jgi:GDSL/SGNH-like Acyl-Esterase family found in Pmr5 and Cas1p
MLSIGSELIFWYLILLTGGHTQENTDRKFYKFLPLIKFRSLNWETNFLFYLIICSIVSKIRWDLYKEGRRIFTDLNPIVAYEIGLTTWASWIDLNLDPNTTKVFFRTVSPRHNRYETTGSFVI